MLFAGRFAAEKSIDALLDLIPRRPDLHFTFAGDGPERKRVEDMARQQENLDYPGWIRRDRLVDLLDSADLFVLPSAVERA